MAVFGPYETVEELPSRPWVRVATARRAGGSSRPDLILKTTRDIVGFDSAEAAGRRRHDLLAGATVQSRVGEGGASRRWAPIRECSESYVVLDRYDRSAADLARQRRLSTGELRAVTSAVLEGLEEIGEACGRGHGRLHAGNVLFRQARGSALGEIVLTDPAAEAPESPVRDLQDLGYLIRHLATGVEEREGEPRDASWAHLGGAAGFWRELARELVGIETEGEIPSLESLRKRVHRRAPKDPSARGRWIALCVAVVVVAGGVGVWSLVLRGEPPPPPGKVAEWWQTVCTDIDGWCRIKDGESLREEIEAVRESGKVGDAKLDGRIHGSTERIIEYWDAVVAAIPEEPGRNTWGALSFENRDALLQADPSAQRPWSFLPEREFRFAVKGLFDAVDELKAALCGGGSSEAWPLPGNLAGLKTGFEDLGWNGAVELVDSTLVSLNPGTYLESEGGVYSDDATPRLAGAIVEAAVLEYYLSGLSGQWGEAEAAVRALEEKGSAGDVVLSGAALALPAVGSDASSWDPPFVKELSGRLAALLPGLRAAREFVESDKWPRVDVERLKIVSAGLLPSDGRPTAETLQAWVGEADLHVKLAEPDPMLLLQEQLAEWLNALNVAVEGVDEGAEDAEVRAVRERIAALEGRLNEPHAWIRKYEQDVRELAAEHSIEVAEIAAVVAGFQKPVEELKAELLGAEAPYPRSEEAALRGAWTGARDGWIAGLDAGTFGSYVVMQARKQLEGALGAIAEAIPEPTLGPEPAAFEAQSVRLAMEGRRGAALDSALRTVNADWDATTFPLTDANMSTLEEIGRGWATWLGQADSALRDLGEAHGRLLSFEPLDGDGGGPISPRGLWERWGSAPSGMVAALGGRDSFGVLFDLVETLGEIENAERAALVGWVENGAASDQARYAAWRRLGVVEPVWPGTADDLTVAAAYVEGRRSAFGERPEFAPRLAELDSEAERRWRLVMLGAMQSGTEAAIETAFTQMAGYGVELALQPDGVRLNHALYVLKGQALRGDNDAARERLAAWRLAAEPLTHRDLERVKAELRGLEEKSEGGNDIERLPGEGPGAEGWTGEIVDLGDRSEEGKALAFTTPDGLRLDFRLLDGFSEPLVYLSTAEVSIGVASWAVGTVGDLSGLAQGWSSLQSRSWQGARAWELNGSGLDALGNPERWYVWDTADALGQKFETGLTLVGAGDASQLPVQNVSFAAAEALARQLGCRLPTPPEWRGAVEMSGASPMGANLRDGSFGRQRDFVTLARQGTSKLPYPDAQVFRWSATAPLGVNAVDGQAGDGVLFFDAVGGEGGFSHLFGNVAEWVSDGGVPMVIGGSALSHPGTETELGTARGVTGRADLRARQCYTDVGFRLALEIEGSLKPSLANLLGDWFGSPRYVRTPE